MKTTSTLTLALVVLAGCASPLENARETAAEHTCTWYASCKDIGSGKTYASTSDCLTQERAKWLDTWPTADCDGKINVSNLDVCVKAIDATTCGNFIDALATASKCEKSKVCSP
jgi:hypothetical protein